MGYLHKPRLVLFCGLPGSGKTTTAKHIAQKTGAIRLCTDEWVDDLSVDPYDEAARDLVQVRLYEHCKELLGNGYDVILEDGLWMRHERAEKLHDAKMLSAKIEFHFFDISFDELWRRLQKRNNVGGHGVVRISKEQLTSWWPLFERPDADELRLYDAVIRHDDITPLSD